MRESLAILARATKIDSSYGPPYCLLADIMDVSDDEGRNSQVDICKACVENTSGDEKKECEELLKKFE